MPCSPCSHASIALLAAVLPLVIIGSLQSGQAVLIPACGDLRLNDPFIVKMYAYITTKVLEFVLTAAEAKCTNTSLNVCPLHLARAATILFKHVVLQT